VAPLLAVVLLNPDLRNLADAAAVGGLIAFPVVLVASVAIYFHWCLSGRDAMAWLTVALIAVALVGTTQSALLLADPPPALEAGVWALAPQVGLGFALLGLALAAARFEVTHDPALMGLGLGVLLTVVLVGAPLAVGPLSAPPAVSVLVDLVIVGTAVAVAVVLMRISTLEAWVRRRLVAVVVLIDIGQALSHRAQEGVVLNSLVIVANTVGSALLCATALALLRWSFGESTHELVLLHGQLEEVEAEVREDRERLHEIGSTIAGIASASQVIRQGSGVSSQRRILLQNMLDAELERLQRLMAASAPLSVRAFSVDEILQQLVLSQEARGRAVHWVPTGHRAVGQPDELAETIHILLENAARHCGPGVVSVEVRESPQDLLEIVVGDDGPGVADELRPTLFEWGARRPDSPGQGIGLHIARTLMTKNGGSLELDDSATRGARFVARLPMARMAHEARSHVA